MKKIMQCSVQPRNQIFVKGYGCLSFAKNMDKNIGKSISKNVSGKYSQKLLDHAEQSATVHLKVIEEATGNLIGNKIADRITKVSRSSQQNNSEAMINTHDKETPKERHISPKETQKIIDDLRLI